DDVRIYSRALSSADVQTLYLDAGIVPPFFLSQPISSSRWAGDNVLLSAIADVTKPVSYQCHKNVANVLGATASILLLTNLRFGNYLQRHGSRRGAIRYGCQWRRFQVLRPQRCWRLHDSDQPGRPDWPLATPCRHFRWSCGRHAPLRQWPTSSLRGRPHFSPE